jgi:hypothetical protein
VVHLVISNFNTDPAYLLEVSNEFVIYDQSDDENIQMLLRKLSESKPGKVRFTENLGHNLVNILDFIIENYDCLPEKIAFLKGNIVPRHCTLQFLKESIDKDFYSYLWDQEKVNDQANIQYILQPGHFLEINNSWYVWDSPHKYFTSLDEFLKFLFADYRHAQFMHFAPGGNYLVEANRIRKNPIALYQGLRNIIGYTWRPAEAFMLERCLPLIFNRTHKLNAHCYDLESFLSALKGLPDMSKVTRVKPKINIQDKVRWKLIEILNTDMKKGESSL